MRLEYMWHTGRGRSPGRTRGGDPTGLGRRGWRPARDLEGRNPEDLEGHCFYTTYDGACYPSYNHWEGRQNATELGDRIGLLLDLDQGTMTVYKNDERLEVMATGLSGEYCWAVELFPSGGGLRSVRIEAAAVPSSPTAEEQAQAVAHEVAAAEELAAQAALPAWP